MGGRKPLGHRNAGSGHRGLDHPAGRTGILTGIVVRKIQAQHGLQMPKAVPTGPA